jgi:hypothetical protein
MNTKQIRFMLGAVILLSCVLSAQAQVPATPGGVNNANYVWAAWLTPDNYNAGTWVNRITTSGTAGDFFESTVANHAKPAKVDGFNYHQAVNFTKSAVGNAFNRLVSKSMSIASGDNVTVILVYERANTTHYAHLFSFYDGDRRNNLTFFTTGSNNLTLYWPEYNNDRTVANTQGKGIVAVSIANNSASAPARGYVDGVMQSTTGGQLAAGGITSPWVIGANGSAAAAGYGFAGKIQEIIVLKAKGADNLIDAADLQKIHSYLAVKYGITLNNTDNYINSDGAATWNRTANSGYNNDIFGIGRDDNSGLNQKQGRSNNSNMLTAYIGGSLTTLNSQNNGSFAIDKTYLLFGSAGGSPIRQLTGVHNGDAYENKNISMSEDPNIQSPVYLAQLTGNGGAAMTVKLRVNSIDFSYALVSKDPDFPNGSGGTKLYPVSNNVSSVEIDQNYKYIKFIGFSPGPGGINSGLRLWLRADDEASLSIDNLPVDDGKLTGYPEVGTATDLPAVSAWSDLVRGQTYSYAAGPSAATHRIPVLKHYSPEMNYYPSVRFWGSGTAYGAYLSNAATNVMPWKSPSDGKHTAYFMVNNNFSTRNWFYTLAFGSTSATTPGRAIPRPGYGVEKFTSGTHSGNVSGRFRTDGTQGTASLNLFSPGATSILGYQTRTANSGSNNQAYFRFNGKEDNSSTASTSADRYFAWSQVNFQTGSTLGSTYEYDRTMQGVMSEAILFDRQLDESELQRLETYLALKYGVTLYPSNTALYAYQRFNYVFSDNVGAPMIWEGNVAKTSEGNAATGRFADFYHNIAAVVRDDAARLHNRHAHSTNVGSLLHLGVAGTRLSDDGSEVGGLLFNNEAVVAGSDGATGNTHITDANPCGNFTDRFKRKWLIHKVTKGGRPISMLIGAQNNASLTIGNDAATTADYYPHLDKSHDVSLIVGESPAAIEAGNYKAVIPMTFINGEHQCAYTFTEDDTYITFGWKTNGKGCVGDEDAKFTGTRKFDWTMQPKWTSARNNSNNAALTISDNTVVELDDNIHVTETKIVYPANVRANRRYPRAVNTPVRGSLEIQRRGGSVNQDVVVTITFDHPVIPEFSISDLDSNEEVDVYGTCSGNPYGSTLSYAGRPAQATYSISGITATVKRRGNISGTNKNGMLNVAFQGGVTSVTIKYRMRNRAVSAMQHIYISPITLRSVPPPPPVNEEGLSFVKQVKERSITTCEPVEYKFFIQNTNCDPKTVVLSDTLPENMSWEVGSFGLDASSAALNPSFDPQIVAAAAGKGEKLRINGLVVPGTTTLELSATAVINEDVSVSGTYDNRAGISYNKSSGGTVDNFYSIDRETLDEYTTFEAEYQPRQAKVTVTPSYSSATYNADSRVTVTYTLTNPSPNPDIPDMFLDVAFNEEFSRVLTEGVEVKLTHVSGNNATPVPAFVTWDPDDGSMFTIAGAANGLTGFTLPSGTTVLEFKFTLKAPLLAGIEDEYADDGVTKTGRKVDLDIAYDFSSGTEDPCLLTSLRDLHGNKLIPFSTISRIITHIITNKNESAAIKR